MVKILKYGRYGPEWAVLAGADLHVVGWAPEKAHKGPKAPLAQSPVK